MKNVNFQIYENCELNRLPRPSRDKELWDQTLQAGFKNFPEREENFRKYKSGKRDAGLDHLPIQLDIENVSRCNYRCSMCQVSTWRNGRRAGDMSFEDFKDLIDSQRGLLEVKMQGMGEPLLGKCFFEMIEYARKRYLWVRTSTNASLLHAAGNYRKLLDSDICEIQVSVDGASKGSYEKIRRGGDFVKVMENCILLNSYGDKIGKKRTRMWSVIQRDNFHELEKFPRFAAELGFDRLSLCLTLSHWGQLFWQEKNDKIDISHNLNIETAENLISAGKGNNVEVTFWFINKKYNSNSINEICPWPFERTYISSDMRIVPCCMIANPAILDLGDAHNLSKEWNGANMASFRKKHLTGNIPVACRSCYKNREEE